jgi:hypothetical protein
MNNTLHAHVSTRAADCDGPVYDEWVVTYSDHERAEQVRAYFNGIMLGYDDAVNDFSDIHFMNRVFTNQCGPDAVHQMTIKVDDDGVEYHESTEEGYRAGTITWCRKDCDTSERSHRDVYAEQMGY